MYKTPTDAKKLELSLGAPECIQKRRPLNAYFANETGPLPNPVFHPESEPKKQEDFMEPQPLVKGKKKDKVRKKLLPALEEADSKAEIGMEEEPAYEDMATEGPSVDSNVENQLIDPESWKDGDVVTGKATEAHDEVAETMTNGAPVCADSESNDTAWGCNERLSNVDPKEHDEEGATGANSLSGMIQN
ncbi:uncharacterized protein LOC120369889 isoform X2 [Mauremys reevesii]|uniref:uncharacterized protein LOC120369889 isoform X2 n=1 Tax=Mauremys reevesii TaxID=260615 RepID=UPI00193FDDE2|nr:uncharacterized protein LOC120369889 isoform X2 [Mauremys reevesii]XP_039339583.1 uncharacterized protein LOC120369889 isoform X2 [Mauremys reevesii]